VYEARNEEATEMRTQQECILSGGVYLRHRLKDNLLPFLFPNHSTTTRGVQDQRSGVLACKKLSVFFSHHASPCSQNVFFCSLDVSFPLENHAPFHISLRVARILRIRSKIFNTYIYKRHY
jgi:hypothetical protein